MKKTNTPVTPAELTAIADRMKAAGQDIEAGIVLALIGSIHAHTTIELFKQVIPFVDGELERIKAGYQ